MAATPKTNRKLAVRTLIGVLALGGLFLGYRKFESLQGDFDRAPANTVGYVLAIRTEEDGQRVVAIRPDGTVIENPGWSAGTVDRDATWSPDGNRIYFVSDRASGESAGDRKGANVFRWNPTSDAEPNQRTTGTGGRSNPSFPDEPGVKENALITSRGFVNDFDPVTGATRQLLPPRGREVAQVQEEGAGGAGSQLSGIYGALGTSFRIAKWAAGGDAIITVMQREDGEVVLWQSMVPVKAKAPDGTFVESVPDPIPLAAGSRIDIAVSPKDGSAVVAVREFDYPTEAQRRAAAGTDGKVRKPFANGVLLIKPDGSVAVIGASPNPGVAFVTPSVAPDGSQTCFVAGRLTDESFTPLSLVTAPLREAGIQGATDIAGGEIYEPTYAPNGSEILFAKRENGKRGLYRVDRGSGQVTTISDKGDFSYPRLSPQAGK